MIFQIEKMRNLEMANSSTHQLINSLTHKLTNSQTHSSNNLRGVESVVVE